MRLGNSKSISYRRAAGRRYRRKELVIQRLCIRLDRLVYRAESLRRGKTRLDLYHRADMVRAKLKAISGV